MADKHDNTEEFDFNSINIEDLADIRDVKIDTSLPIEERVKSYLEQIKNPNLYRCGDIIIRATFADNGSTLQNRLTQYLSTKAWLEAMGLEDNP